MKIKRMVLTAILLGLAMIIFIAEAQLPPIVPVPGIKLGLANVINLIALYLLGRKETFIILVLRIILSSIFVGNGAMFLYSLSGGLVCFLFMSVMSLFMKESSMWVVSVFGAAGHNIGQIAAACILMKTPQLIRYLPILMISAVVTGCLTGITANITMKYLRKINIIKEITGARTDA